jgi:uncharacterized protein YprB with RNaseH-like and TPR domain
MSEDALRRRLSRLGSRKRKKSTPVQRAPKPAALPIGEDVETPLGKAYRIEQLFTQDHLHGSFRLDAARRFSAEMIAKVTGKPDVAEIESDKLVYLDTETTGLAGGAGTIVFLVGVGVFHRDVFRLRQYFLRNPGEEAGMLSALQEDLEAAAGFVSFNGRVFDLPLLEMRYMLSMRRRWQLTAYPQVDLMYPARRLWRRSLPDCTLNTIERMQLGVQRSDEDVRGDLIPGIYHEYLRTGETLEIARVIYHNAVDVLSLVSLSAALMSRFQAGDPSRLSGGEALALGRWHSAQGRFEDAEAAFIAALKNTEPALKVEALQRYTGYLKRQDRRKDAVEGWEMWHTLAPDDPKPCIELAMYYEWHAQDLSKAHGWSEKALQCLSHWPQDWRRDESRTKIEHRLERLARKMEADED